jgi:hypothetical protein
MIRFVTVVSIFGMAVTSAFAENIHNPIATFAGLDKIMGVTTNFEAKLGEQVKFGGLLVKADVCNTTPITEAPKTAAFVGMIRRIAYSPAGCLLKALASTPLSIRFLMFG